VRRLTGATRPGDRQPDPDDLLIMLDVRAIIVGVLTRMAEDGDVGPWFD
jgi:hypothetical protein